MPARWSCRCGPTGGCRRRRQPQPESATVRTRFRVDVVDDVVGVGVGGGRVTPRKLGRPNVLARPQQVRAADWNSGPHSRRAADCASTKLGVFSPSPAKWTSAHAMANTGTLCRIAALCNSSKAASEGHRRRPMRIPRAVSRMRPEFGPYEVWAGTQFVVMLCDTSCCALAKPLPEQRQESVRYASSRSQSPKGALCNDLRIRRVVPVHH